MDLTWNKIPKVKSCCPHRRSNTAGPRLADPAWRSRGSSNEHPWRARPVPRYRAANEGDQRVQPLRPATCIRAPPDRKKSFRDELPIVGFAFSREVAPHMSRGRRSSSSRRFRRITREPDHRRFPPFRSSAGRGPGEERGQLLGEYSVVQLVHGVHAKRRARGHDAGRVARGRARERDSVAE